jgi:hypothetical protein
MGVSAGIAGEFSRWTILVYLKEGRQESCETLGLSEELLRSNPEQSIRIPIHNPVVRSLNLSTSAGIILYEALRQVGHLD